MRDILDSDEERHLNNLAKVKGTFITEHQQSAENERVKKIELRPRPLDLN